MQVDHSLQEGERWWTRSLRRTVVPWGIPARQVGIFHPDLSEVVSNELHPGVHRDVFMSGLRSYWETTDLLGSMLSMPSGAVHYVRSELQTTLINGRTRQRTMCSQSTSRR